MYTVHLFPIGSTQTNTSTCNENSVQYQNLSTESIQPSLILKIESIQHLLLHEIYFMENAEYSMESCINSVG